MIASLLGVDADWLLNGHERRPDSTAQNRQKNRNKPSEAEMFDPVPAYGSSFDKESQRVAARYLALNRGHRKLIRDLIAALEANNPNG